MKLILLSLLLGFFVSSVTAQVPQAINYQAVARDVAGNPITNATISVQFRIWQGSSALLAYTETHTGVITNQVGLFNLQIGRGTTTDIFSNIDWLDSPCDLEVSIDPAGGSNYQFVGKSEMLSVPYALRTACPNCTGIYDGDLDTWVETDRNGFDDDEIHMALGGSPLSQPGITKLPVLKLRWNNPAIVNNTTNSNTMLEIFDLTTGKNTFIGENAGVANITNPLCDLTSLKTYYK